MAKPLLEGCSIPDFKTTDESGEIHSSDSLRGGTTLLYFYPRDNTPGCTLQACDLRDTYMQFSKIPISIYGLSGCSVSSHQRFSAKNSLPFPLLLDEDNKIAQLFGVWGEKKFMGKTFNGIHRTSFLISKKGEILKTYLKVKPKIHAQMILKDLTSLKL
jgi:peroxiredoxin Q/BCP